MANHVRGEKHPASKLTEKDIRLIRKIYRNKGMNVILLGFHFGVSQGTISQIINNKIWRHVLED